MKGKKQGRGELKDQNIFRPKKDGGCATREMEHRGRQWRSGLAESKEGTDFQRYERGGGARGAAEDREKSKARDSSFKEREKDQEFQSKSSL